MHASKRVRVAVGTRIAPRPPHRSRRALLLRSKSLWGRCARRASVSSVWSRRSVTRCPSGPLPSSSTALQAMRGIDLVAAVTVLAEIGDLSRFHDREGRTTLYRQCKNGRPGELQGDLSVQPAGAEWVLPPYRPGNRRAAVVAALLPNIHFHLSAER